MERTDSEERSALLFAVVSIILALNAIILEYLRSSRLLYGDYLARIFEVVALIWLLGALAFLYGALNTSRLVQTLRESYGMTDGDVSYVEDDRSESNILYSSTYGLRGRPDYILQVEGKNVPVEVKSGREPRGPLFSHILQVGGYCLLLEEETKQRPEYGIVKYGKKEHKIHFDEKLRNTVLSKIGSMREILVGDSEAHRNHNKPGKCLGCSRRSVCPEKLA